MRLTTSLLVATAALLSACQTPAPAPGFSPEIASMAALKAVKVIVRIGETGNCGTAVLIGTVASPDSDELKGLFLTVGHIRMEDTHAEVGFIEPGTYHPVDILQGVFVSSHDVLDAALFVVPVLPEGFSDVVPLAASDAVPGEWILSAGYANCGRIAMFPGYVCSTVPPVTQSSAWIVHAMSGGPVLNAEGELVGITVAIGQTSMDHFFIPISPLKDWIEWQLENLRQSL